MEPRPEPEAAHSERARLWRSLKRMGLLSLVVAIAAAGYVGLGVADASIHMMIAAAILAGGSVLIGTVLMTIMFYSAHSGHDAAAADNREKP